MPHKRSFLPKILLFVGFLSIFLIFRYQDKVKAGWLTTVESAKVFFDNLFYGVGAEPERQRPISMVDIETEISLYFGEPFRSFSEDDWNSFWSIIYDVFPREIPGRPDLPNKTRQLTINEITEELIKRYSNPFAYFKEEHWKAFFGVALKK